MRSVTAKAVVLVLAFSCVALAQDFHFYPFTMLDQDMLGSGARARAMGGAFLGVSNDASALTWNPAGLTLSEKTHVAVSGNLNHLEMKNNISYQSPGVPGYLGNYKDNKVQLSYGSFISPLRIKGHPVTLAAGYQKAQNYLDEHFNWIGAVQTIVFQANGVVAINDQFSSTKFSSDLDEYLLGFGTDIYGKLAIGGRVSIYSGKGTNTYRSFFLDTGVVVSVGGITDTAVFNRRQSIDDKVNIKGYDFTGSLLYHGDKFSVGAVIQAPYQLIYDHDLARSDTIFVKTIDVTGEGIPSARSTTLYRGKTKQQIPLTIGVGGSVKPTENLTLAADFQYRATKDAIYYVRTEEAPRTERDSINLLTLPSSIYYVDSAQSSYYTAAGDYIELFNEFPMKYENTYQISVGGEYMLASRYGTIPIRGGFRYTALPYRDASNLFRDLQDQVQSGFKLGKRVTRSTVTFGSGIHWTQVWLDFAVELNSEDEMQSGSFELVSSTRQYSDTRKRNNSSVIVNFTGFF